MIHFKRQLTLYLVALATAFGVTSCATTTITEENVPCQANKELSVAATENLEISLHVDGSGSMLGYVDSPRSRYVRTLNLLNTVLSGDGNRQQKPQLKYFRSGNQQNQSINYQQYREAEKPKFYTGKDPKFPPVSSQLNAILTPIENSDRLLVIVTDLEQNDGDIINLVNTLEKNYLNPKTPQYVVGVLGVKSEFKGTIFSTTPKVYPNKTYSTEGKSLKEYRPLYVVFVGPYEDVKYYYQRMLSKDQELIESSEFVIFSPYRLVESATTPQLTTPLPNDLIEPFSLQQGKIAFEPKPKGESSYLLLEMDDKGGNQALSLPYQFNFTPLEYTLKPEQLKIKSQIQMADNLEGKLIDQSNNANLRKGVSIENLNLEDQTVSFNSMINPSAFSEAGIYLVSFDLGIENLADEAWWPEWDWGSDTNGQQQQPNGAKTYQLLDFMTSLKSRMTDGQNQPVLTRFCYGIQKN
jgi:hypothetical protein